MKLFVIFSFLLVFVACSDSHTSLEVDTPLDTVCIESCIEDAFKYYLQNVDKYNPCLKESVCYYVQFYKYAGCRDTMVDIGRYRINAYPKGYKGCTEIDTFKVLVFDEDDLGGDFYNTNLLEKDEPCISDMPSRDSNDEILFGLGMVVQDSVINWRQGVLPDNWKPIPIRKKR